jgi:ribosomal protein S18 acetylase RimI-like enzyme
MPEERPRIVVAPQAEAIRRFFSTDPLFGAYALGYLDPVWRGSVEMVLAVDGAQNPVALVLRRQERPQPHLLVFGRQRGVMLALSDPTVSAWRRDLRLGGQEVWLSGQGEALAACAGFFYVMERRTLDRQVAGVSAGGAWRGAHRRAASATASAPRLLTLDDAPLLNVLYSLPPHEPFAGEEIARGAYYGIVTATGEGRRCIAAAGTHVAAPPDALVAIGNVYTAPPWRGRGHATACVAALCLHYLEQGYRSIVLNVDPQNVPAVRVYARLGFRRHCSYQELRAVAL